MKKLCSVLLSVALLLSILPAALGAESWETAETAGKSAGVRVTWYPEYESLTRLYGTDRMILQKNGLYGLFDLEGTAYTLCEFDAIGQPDEQGVLTACRGGKWGQISQNGGVATDFLYETEGEAKAPVNAKIVRKGGLFAVADLGGKLLTDYKYWNAHPFAYGYAAVQNDKQEWGYVDATGKEVVPCRYYSGDVLDFQADGLAVAGRPGAYQIVDGQGRELLAQTSEKMPWRAGFGLLGYTQDGKVGYMDTNGQMVVEPQYVYYTDPKSYLYGGSFGADGVAQVYPAWGEKPIYIDTTGAVQPDYQPAEFRLGQGEGLSWVSKTGELLDPPWGFQNDQGELVVPCLYDAVGPFDRGYASVQVGGVYGMLEHPLTPSEQSKDFDGLSITWLKSDNYLSPLGRDRLIVEYHILERSGMMGHSTSGNYGLRNLAGTLIQPVQYGTTLAGGHHGNGFFCVDEVKAEDGTVLFHTGEKGNTFTDADMKIPRTSTVVESAQAKLDAGELVPQAPYDSIADFSEGLALVWKDGKCGFMDEKGALIVPYVFDDLLVSNCFQDGLALMRKGPWTGILKNPLNEDVMSDWAAAEVKAAREKGLVPQRADQYFTYEMSRLQFAELAVNLVETLTGKEIALEESLTFTDTTDPAALKAASAGIVAGVGDGRFAPDELLNREQLAAMLYRAVRLYASQDESLWPKETVGEEAMQPYTDADQISEWAQVALPAMVKWGILKGTSGTTLSPKDSCTVEEGILLTLRTYQSLM